jgi:Pyruvate/2-oxoacid:ferredoxin oxidoreductase gamma subunit
VPKDAMLESIKTTVPAKTIDKNVEAFNRGYNHVKEQGVKG